MRRIRLVRNLRLGIKSLLRHKLRSLLTVLGVVFGVGSVVAMLSVGEGASAQAMEQIRKLGSNNIILRSLKPAEDQQSGNARVRMSMYGLLYEDADRISQTLPTVRTTVPAKTVRMEARIAERSMELRVVGTTPGWFRLVRRGMLAGRVLNDTDHRDRKPVCVLTEHGARKMLATTHSVGQSIRIGGNAFEVIGIVRSEELAGAVEAPDRDVDAYVPLTLARERFGDYVTRRSSGSREREKVELHQVLVQVNRIEDVEPTAAAIETMLRRFHKRADYEISVPLALLRQAEATKRTFNIVLGSIAGISLVVGGIGIMNIMLASVTERTREIGIRRAIGARRRQIVSQFLVETVVLSTIGGLLGIALGLALPWLITRFSDMPTVVPVYSIVLSLGISIGIGLIFGIYPAVRAARLDPIVALRHE